MKNHLGTGVSDIEVRGTNSEPWQEADGNPLSDESLRFVSRYWSAETWEKYLLTIETPQAEYLSSRFGNLLYQNDLKRAFLKHLNDSNEESYESPVHEIPSEVLEQAISQLTLRERQAIQAIFYNGLSQTDAAKVMRISAARIHQLLRRALQKLKAELTPVL